MRYTFIEHPIGFYLYTVSHVIYFFISKLDYYTWNILLLLEWKALRRQNHHLYSQASTLTFGGNLEIVFPKRKLHIL